MMKRLLVFIACTLWSFQVLAFVTPEPVLFSRQALYQQPSLFQFLNAKSQIILTVEDFSNSSQWRMASELIRHLQRTGWLKKMMLADLPDTAQVKKTLAEFNKLPASETDPNTVIDLFDRYIRNMGLLNLLQQVHKYNITVSPGTTFNPGGRKNFDRQYATEAARAGRARSISKKLPRPGFEYLIQAFGYHYVEVDEAFNGSEADAMKLYFLDAQISLDEATAFYGQEPGTLIIISASMHASYQTGVGAILKSHNPFLQIANVLISQNPDEIRRQKYWSQSAKEQALNAIHSMLPHYHFWLAPDTSSQ